MSTIRLKLLPIAYCLFPIPYLQNHDFLLQALLKYCAIYRSQITHFFIIGLTQLVYFSVGELN